MFMDLSVSRLCVVFSAAEYPTEAAEDEGGDEQQAALEPGTRQSQRPAADGARHPHVLPCLPAHRHQQEARTVTIPAQLCRGTQPGKRLIPYTTLVDKPHGSLV